jgi:5S rRNA maturation endonuclease (ribonuclease M5)/archaellum biogenesis ATPase FlaH
VIAQSTYHSNLAELAAGRELEILERVAGIPHEYLNKKGHPCPRCGGKDRFSLIDETKGTVFCRHCFNHGNRGYVNAVIHYGQATDYKEAKKMILEHLTGDQSQPQPPQPVQKTSPKIVKTWLYRDKNGKGVKKINRWEPGFSGTSKSMTPEVFHNGKWFMRANFKNREAEWEPLWSNVAGLPLNLPEIIKRKNEAVYIVEGETCFDQLNDWGFLATTGSGGVNTKTDWSNYLQNRTVIILPDNDDAGYKYALKTAQSLQDKAKNIRVVFLPDLEEKGDIVDWAKKGGTKKQFLDIVSKTTAWDGKPFAFGEPEQPKLGDQIEYRYFSEIPHENVEYLLQDIIPLSTVTVFVGDAGDGKSYFSTWLAASVTKSGCYFRGQPIPNGKVIICNTEDHAGNTIGPRLKLNGANMDQVIEVPAIRRTIRTKSGVIESYMDNITFDKIQDVRTMLNDHPTCKLVIFDPLSAFWGDVNENKNAEVRVVMSHLKRIAEDHRAAIVLVTHFNKGLSCQAMSRVTGSLALTAASRATWSITNDRETNIRTVACVKMNLSENRAGFTFEIADGQINILDEYIDITADEVLQNRMVGQQNKKRGPQSDKLGECCDWLRGFLATGPVSSTIIFEKAAEAGYSERTVKTAKKEAKIESKKEHFSGRWVWSISPLFEECKIYSGEEQNGNFAPFEENQPNPPVSTVAPHCENPPNNVTKTPSLSTVGKHCGKPQKSPESDETIITTSVEEIEERVNQILEERITEAISKKEQLETIKKERMDRINRQAEENLKKLTNYLKMSRLMKISERRFPPNKERKWKPFGVPQASNNYR